MKTYIWTLPTRLFHWLLLLGLVSTYILGETEGSLNLHSSIGYTIGILIIFRIIWGFFGPKHSHFRDFPISISLLKNFAKDMNQSKEASLGHNPLASIVMLGIIIVTLLVVLSGIATLSADGQGLFSFISFGNNEETFKEIHEVMVNILLFLTVLHLLGNVVDLITRPQTGTAKSMLHGYKNVKGENVTLNKFQIILATLGIVAALAIFPYSLKTQQLKDRSEKSEQFENGKDNNNEEDEDDD